jgi:hypothetical protein
MVVQAPGQRLREQHLTIGLRASAPSSSCSAFAPRSILATRPFVAWQSLGAKRYPHADPVFGIGSWPIPSDRPGRLNGEPSEPLFMISIVYD